MKLVTYISATGQSVGVLDGPDVIDLNMLIRQQAPSGRPVQPWMSDITDLLTRADWRPEIEGMLDADTRRGRGTGGTPLTAAILCPPVLRPSKVIGAGMNYHSFLRGIGLDPPQHPALFNKTSSALTGHHGVIRVPPITDQPVPEGELAVIIGRQCHRVRPEDAPQYIAGLTCANDVSARNLEFETSQWTAGKMLPTFAPLGPAMVTLDECPDLDALSIITRLNGTVIQSGCTSDMVFGVADLLSLISHRVRLEVGDVILTGTPSDLGEGPSPVHLRHGDLISVEIQGIGNLVNRVEADNDDPADLGDSTQRQPPGSEIRAAS